MFDGISLLIVAGVAMNVFYDEDRVVAFAVQYYALSIFTSILSYIGCFIIYYVTQTLEIGVISFLVDQGGAAGSIVGNPLMAVGGILITTKLAFLLGLFPFQRYVMDVSSACNYGFLSFFLVISKLPVLVVAMQFLKVF